MFVTNIFWIFSFTVAIWCAESTNGKPVSNPGERLQLSSVSTALALAIGIGIFEASALLLGSGFLLNLMGISPVCYTCIFPLVVCFGKSMSHSCLCFNLLSLYPIISVKWCLIAAAELLALVNCILSAAFTLGAIIACTCQSLTGWQ